MNKSIWDSVSPIFQKADKYVVKPNSNVKSGSLYSKLISMNN